MKKLFILIVLIIAVMASGLAQDKLKIGEVKSGKVYITNPDALRAFFNNTLEKSGTLGKDYKLSAAPEGDRFFVYYPVSDNKDKVTSIGVVLVKKQDDVFIVSNPPSASTETTPGGGGSATIECFGAPCNSCYPNVSWPSGNWFPVVQCQCYDPDGVCNMSLEFTISINISY